MSKASRSKKKDKSSLASYFLSLTVENLRCFGPKQTLDLSDGKGRPAQWTVILGDNGTGKTTLLQSIAAISPVAEYMAGYYKRFVPRFFSTPDFRFKGIWNPFRDSIGMESFRVSAAFFTGTSLTEGEVIKDLTNFYLLQGRYSGEISGTEVDLGNLACFGYGAARRMGETALSDKNLFRPSYSLFIDDASLLNAEELLLQADYAASKPSEFQERAIKRRDQIIDVLIKLLPDVDEIKFVQKGEPSFKSGIELKTPYGWAAIDQLGLGYKTLIAWIADLASGLFETYPDSDNPLEEPAVVLVDEIDLHLHPKWQRTIMSYLSERFTNTQFIVTAHSPLIVQASTDANIVLLKREGDHVVINNDVKTIRNWRIDQVLTSDLFGLESARPPQLDELMAERKRILSKSKLTKKDEQRLRVIEKEIGPLPSGETQEDIQAMEIIRRAAEHLKKRNNQPPRD